MDQSSTPSRSALACYSFEISGHCGPTKWCVSHAGPDVLVSLQYGQDWRFLRTDEAYHDGRLLIMDVDRGKYRAVMPLTVLLARLASVEVAELPAALASNKAGVATFRDTYKNALYARNRFINEWPVNLTAEDRAFITERVTSEWPHSRWAWIEHPEDCAVRLRAALKERNCPWTALALRMIEKPVAPKGGDS